MNDKMKTLQLKEFNTDYRVTLIYDKCKTGESQYGPWNLYGVEYDGELQSLFVEDDLHKELKKYGKGAKLVLRRNQDYKGNLAWQVIPQNGKNGNGTSNRSNQTVYHTLMIEQEISIDR